MGLYSWQDRHASKTGQRLQSQTAGSTALEPSQTHLLWERSGQLQKCYVTGHILGTGITIAPDVAGVDEDRSNVKGGAPCGAIHAPHSNLAPQREQYGDIEQVNGEVQLNVGGLVRAAVGNRRAPWRG